MFRFQISCDKAVSSASFYGDMLWSAVCRRLSFLLSRPTRFWRAELLIPMVFGWLRPKLMPRLASSLVGAAPAVSMRPMP